MTADNWVTVSLVFALWVGIAKGTLANLPRIPRSYALRNKTVSADRVGQV